MKASLTLKAYLWGLALVALLAGSFTVAVFADVESYKELKATPSEIITGASGADSTVATTAISDRIRYTNSNTTVAVACDLSGSAGDTVVVSCLLYRNGTFIGLSTATATAGAFTDAASDSICPMLFFDLSGADGYEIRHATPSAGNADLRWWAFGASSQQ